MHGTGKPLGRYSIEVPKSARAEARRVADVLADAERVLVLGHAHADGDVAGASLALACGLREQGKQVTVYNEAEYPEGFAWLPGGDRVELSLKRNARFDATVVVDAADPDRCGRDFPPAERRGTFIWIDHHHIDTPPGDVNYIDLTAAAVGEQVVEVLDAMGHPISLDVAKCAYASLLSDTGSFRYGNTTGRALALAGRLVGLGVNPWEMTERIYESQDESKMRLLGAVLSRFERTADGRFGVAMLTQDDLDAVGASWEHTQGLVNHIRGISGIEIAALVHPHPKGTRVILRSRGTLACSPIAQRLGGKGHNNAATFVVDRTVRAAKKDLLAAIEEVYADAPRKNASAGKGRRPRRSPSSGDRSSQ